MFNFKQITEGITLLKSDDVTYSIDTASIGYSLAICSLVMVDIGGRKSVVVRESEETRRPTSRVAGIRVLELSDLGYEDLKVPY